MAKLDGPLQDDAVLALGKIGDKRALEVLESLQRTAPRESQPSIATAICLLGINCASHQSYLVDTLAFAIKTIGFQDLLRASARALASLATAGTRGCGRHADRPRRADRDPARPPIALAFGTVALRNTAFTLKLFESRRI